MIDYTPHHKYTEIVDYIPDPKKVLKGKIIGCLLLFVYIGIVVWLFLKMVYSAPSIWAAIQNFLLFVFIALILGVVFLLIWGFNSPSRPRLRANYANVIKHVIGYDFGDDYKLLYTGSHDYEEYLYIFSEESFAPFREYLDSMKDGVQEGTNYYVQHCYKGKEGAGFTLVEDRLGEGPCGNIEAIDVDYDERTLKHTFTVF